MNFAPLLIATSPLILNRVHAKIVSNKPIDPSLPNGLSHRETMKGIIAA
jgi:hypothetical protein